MDVEMNATPEMANKVTKTAELAIKAVKTGEEIAIGVAIPMIVMSFCPKDAKIWTKAAFMLTGAALGGILTKMNSKRLNEAMANMAKQLSEAAEKISEAEVETDASN